MVPAEIRPERGDGAEARYRLLVHEAPLGILVLARDSTILFANPAALAIVGDRDARAVLGRSAFDFAADDAAREEMTCRAAGVLEGEAGNGFESRLRRADGSVVDVELRAVRSEEDGEPRLHVLMRDVTERNRLARERDERAREFTALAENAPDVIGRFDPDLRMLYLNRAFDRIFPGADRTRAIGKTFEELKVPMRTRTAWNAALRTVFASGEELSIEVPLPLEDGLRFYRTRLAPERDESGRVRSVLAITHDTTEERQSADLLRFLEALLLTLGEAHTTVEALELALRRLSEQTRWPLGLAWMLDPKSQRLTCTAAVDDGSPDLVSFVGCSRAVTFAPGEGAVGRAWTGEQAEWVPQLDVGELIEPRRAAAQAAGLRSALFVRVIAQDRPLAVIELYGLRPGRADDPRVRTIAAAAAQLGLVLRRKQAEEALTWQESLLRAITAAAPQGILVVDNPATNVLYVNQRFIDVLGIGDLAPRITAGELTGREIGEICAERTLDPQAFGDPFPLLRHSDNRSMLEDTVAMADGRHIRRMSVQVRDPADRFLGRMYVVEDVTERVQLEQQLRQSQKMEAVGRLAGGIAHDFNNLLTAIQSYTDFVLADLPRSDPMREDVEEIRHAADRATALTRQLLVFTRQQQVLPRPLDLSATVANLGRMLRRLIPENVEVVTALAPDLPAIVADPGQVEQVVLNLVVNARDAMPNGGRLQLETGQVVMPTGRTGVLGPIAPGPYVCLTVADTGVGMDDAIRARIFDPFFTTKDVGKGTGLGLSTVYGIVQQAGGDIDLASTPGEGSRFAIYFPVGSAPLAPAEPLRAPPRAGGRERVLLVEDEPTVRRLARRILEGQGYTVLEARNAGEALLLFEREPSGIDLLLTDVIMPVMNGHELAGRLKASAPGLPVVYTSGYTADALPAELDPHDGFVPKPFTSGQLLSAVRSMLDTRARG